MIKAYKNILPAILAISCFVMLTILSCNSNDNNCLCTGYGICNNGTCICQQGYAGAQCQTLIRGQYTGVWVCTQTCNGAASLGLGNSGSFLVNIDSTTQSRLQVQISSFSPHYTTPLISFVTLDSLIIVPQVMPNSDTVQGWATYKSQGSTYGEHGDILLTLIVNNHGLSDTCIIAGNK